MPPARSGPSRRSVLMGTSALVTAALAGLPAGVALGAAGNLAPATADTLLRMIRDLFPHDGLDDAPYRAVLAQLDAAAADPDTKALLVDGVAQLDAAGGGSWRSLAEAERVAALRAMAATPFFATVRPMALFGLYGNKAVWPRFGYQGSSWEYGGYIDRGFDDLDWLPEPVE